MKSHLCTFLLHYSKFYCRNLCLFIKYICGVSRQLPQRAAREPQIVLFLTHVYDTKMYFKNYLISVYEVFFPQLSNLQKLFRILFLAENISGTPLTRFVLFEGENGKFRKNCVHHWKTEEKIRLKRLSNNFFKYILVS